MNKIQQILGLGKLKLTVSDWCLLALPAAVWFSYQPLIEFGRSENMYFELSIALLGLLFFALTSIPQLWRARRQIFQNKFCWLAISFALWNLLTLIWSGNQLRGLLTAGVVWLLLAAFLRIITHPKIHQLLPALTKIFIASAAVVSLLAWLQMLLDIVGLPMETTLICVGCQFEYFGFPRAVGFAIEPQFLGSLLLAPILLLVVQTYKKTAPFWHNLLTGFLLITFFMTLSRGAIYALVIGLVVLLAINHKKLKQNLQTIGLTITCFIISLAAQGTMVAINPSVNENFAQGVAKSLHHLSLGTLDFRQSARPLEPNILLTDEVETAKSPDVYFDGYVAESTDARLSFNELAYDAWKSSPTVVLFGAGLGSAGVAMHQTHPDQIGQLEITQNQYTEIPLELGIVGFALFLSLLIVFFYKTSNKKWTWALALAFLAQWIFFSGYPNAIHIYLIFFLLLMVPENQLKKPPKSD
ncbi:MAG: O-antigen ligase family protein [Candidatus Nomurabacteria bacterium]|jgi:hypothetical protein|nr:O-antigen ligase family protein [Candidatus Nomurabacteria bacterium]